MTHHKVVIVGAGISGLAAAQLLSEKNVDYIILEARDRVGGRIRTCREGMTPYDLGASWAHDTLTNPLFDKILSESDEAEEDRYGLYYDDQRPLYFGSKVGPKYLDNHKIEQVVKELEKYIELEYFEDIDKPDVSLYEIVMQYLQKQGRMLTEEQVLYAPQLVRHLELWHGIGWKEMSSKFGLVDNVGRNCLFREGYDKVVTDIVSSLDENRILQKAIVTKINHSKSPIRIELSHRPEITADWIICTVPQSILQLEIGEKGSIEWIPSLPNRIKDSLSNMSWGKLGKIVFEFDEPWWGHHNVDRFVALANPDPSIVSFWEALKSKTPLKTGANINQTKTLPDSWDFPVLLLNLQKIANVPAILCFTQGDLTEYLERNPEEAWDYMRPIITKLTDHSLENSSNSNVENIKPTKTFVSEWTVDPFSRGSYAACKPGNDPTDLVIQLSRGMNNVRFAGEHTILDGAGAVHGAWMSGRREARNILIKEGIIEGELEEW
ncbi:hypothetical protein PMKS-000534 [Pichia membranifaciens]|uniref:Amine oxidase n=1 Tax=Pichia membranifaciens TaxID=4926 RepID=A0A1Q2YCE3_9ASCO|nr:hypothetical protein PMKS-000534 [Pichia membranifaciens]